MSETQSEQNTRPTRYPKNIQITASYGITFKTLPEKWNQLPDAQKTINEKPT